jgi:hypothetical protein
MFGVFIAIASVLSSMGPIVQGTAVHSISIQPTKVVVGARIQRQLKEDTIELVEVQVRAILRIPFEFLTKSARSKTTASTWRP